jgi:hypothetical protein
MDNKSPTYKIIRSLVILGDILYFLWIFYNGIDDDFHASPMQLVSYVGILILLVVNAIIIYNH